MEARFQIDLNAGPAAGCPHATPDDRWPAVERTRSIQPKMDHRCRNNASALQRGTSGALYSRWPTYLCSGNRLYLDSLPARSQYAQNGLEAAVWPDSTAIPAFDLNAPADFSGGTKQLVTQAQANTLVSLPGPSAIFPLIPTSRTPVHTNGISRSRGKSLRRRFSPSRMRAATTGGSTIKANQIRRPRHFLQERRLTPSTLSGQCPG